MLMEAPKLSKVFFFFLLRKFYISVAITKHEHTVVLKEFGLASGMPNDWNGTDPLARYSKAGIRIIETT